MSDKNKIQYSQWTFVDKDIKDGNVYLSIPLMSDVLEANTFSATVECEDKNIINFERNTPLTYYNNGQQKGIFYVQNITRNGPTEYTISATSAIGLLIEGIHYGGIYAGQTVSEILPEICGSIPYAIKTSLRDIALYGWLPVATPRDNLSQVLFAVGAVVKTDLDGVLHIEGLWDGISEILPKDRIYQSPNVTYASKVTQVVVTEHQYLEGGETEDLFSGTTQQGDIITFNGPMHNLQAEGFEILESNANFARVSAGTGTLTGNSYIHNTRQVTEDVLTANEPNVKTVTDATLISAVNAVDVARRVGNYYKSIQTINADTVYQGESPGDLISTWHPYDSQAVSACLMSTEITLSNTLKATEELLVGFVPLKVGEYYFNTVEKITQSTTWTVPDGVDNIRIVLIGGGQGGASGLPGEPPVIGEATTSYVESSNMETYRQGRGGDDGGAGGTAGAGGEGGKVYTASLSVAPGQQFPVVVGSPGAGGLYSATQSNPGEYGTATTFGSYSSDNGTSTQGGWIEEVSQEVLAAAGVDGIPGSKGTGRVPNETGDWPVVKGPSIVVNGVEYTSGQDKNTEIYNDGWGSVDGSYGYIAGHVYGSFGGGAAYGNNGGDGSAPGSGSVTLGIGSVRVIGPIGGSGATALAAPDSTVIGQGGTGGNGGGGGGAPGLAIAENQIRHNAAKAVLNTPTPPAAPGGAGSNGSAGGPGGVIIYYSQPQDVESGPFVTSENKFFIDKNARRLVV